MIKLYIRTVCICLQILALCTPLYADGKVVYKSKGDCVDIAASVYVKAIQQAYSVRLVSGWDENNQPHRWVEYWNSQSQKWCLWDEAIWYVHGRSAYTPEEHGYKRRIIMKVTTK